MSDVLLMSARRGHHREVIKGCFWVVSLALMMGLSQWLPLFQRVEFLIYYVPLNIIFEVSAFAIAMMIFGMAWVTQRYRPSLQTLVIGIGFLGIGLFDLSHVLSYQDLPAFVTPNTPEKAINFWLAARSLSAVLLLYVAFLPSLMEKRPGASQRRGLLGLMLALVVLVHAWFLLFPEYVPDTYVVGQGLTGFKVHFEYVIISAHVLAALGLANRYRSEGFVSYLYLAVSAAIMAMAEHFFTIYIDFTDANNILGHLYKIITYGFLYRALFREMVYEPYQSLRDARSRLQATMDALPDSLFEVTRQGEILSVYAGGETGDFSRQQVGAHTNVREWLSPAAATTFFDALHTADLDGVAHDIRIHTGPEGQGRHLGLSVSKKQNAGASSFLVLSRDISLQVENETRILHETRLNAALLLFYNLANERDEQHLLACGAEQAAVLTASSGTLIHLGRDDGTLLQEAINFGEVIAPAAQDRQAWQQAADSGLPVSWNTQGGGICVPVIENGGVRLVITAFGKATGYGDQDRNTLNMLACTLWSRLRQCRQHREIQLLSKALEQNPYPVIITDDKVRIQYVNKAFTRVSGYSANEVMGHNPKMLKSGKTDTRVYTDMWTHLNRGQAWKGELLNRRRNGTLYCESASIYPICDDSGRVVNYVAHKEDVTQHRENEERLRQLSQFDQLTGVLNKHAFEQQLTQQLSRARARGDGLSLLWLDLDNFRSVNDTLGYVAGDELLVDISNRLRSLLAPGSIIGRPEGDSFVLAVESDEQKSLALLAERVLQHVQEPVSLHDNSLSLSASLGIATFPHDGDNAVNLFKAAELAMYKVKQDGRNGLRFYAPEMQKHSERALALATALKYAIAHNELTLVYQPQFDLQCQRMTGAEALLRWHHAELGVVSPAEFIPLAEQNGLIVSIGWWVIDRVLEQLVSLRRLGQKEVSIAVNVSAVQLVQPDFVTELQARVEASGVPAGALDLELTESVAMVNPQETGEKIARLSAAGFCISIDDFGTGYSSMSYLKRFSVDKIKIDKSFIDEVTHNHEDKTIVNAIIHMARNLGMSTIAEGVETQKQLETLQRKGCDAIQGYWYSRPLAADDFAAFVQEHG